MPFKEIAVADTGDLKNGEMKAFDADGRHILITRINDEYYATGSKCTHYGAPLEKGALNNGEIICPWHHATFNAQSGKMTEPPALKNLPVYETRVAEGTIYVRIPTEEKSESEPDSRKYKDEPVYVIVGAGAAGNAAAESLRDNGYIGRIVMITRENRIPYDRPNLSKEYMQGKAKAEWMPLRSEDFFKKKNIELMLNRKVKEADAVEKKILFDDDDELRFDKILFATGGVPVFPGNIDHDFENVFTLRSQDDADLIISAAKKSKRVVIVGAGFIGMELAHGLRERELEVTVITPGSVPFEKHFGVEIGKMFLEQHKNNDIKFALGRKADELQGSGTAKSVVLDNGEEIETDMVIFGVGVKPETGYIKGLEMLLDGSIRVDEYFRAGDDVFAAGDIATFPDWITGEEIRIEHWRTAEQQGRIAGANMAGKKIENNSVPFFWTQQAGINFGYVGHAEKWDHIVIKGSLARQDFLAYYIKSDKVLAVAGCNHDTELAAIEGLMKNKTMPPPELVQTGKMDYVNLAKLSRGD